MQPPRLLVESAGGAEVGRPELDPRVLDAVPQDIKRTAALNFGRESLQELFLDQRAVVLGELLPLLGLSRKEEVDHIAWQEAERTVVFLRLALAIPAWRRLPV